MSTLPPDPTGSSASPAYILLVADDLMIPARVREGVKPLGLQVKTVATATAAQAAASAEPAPRAALVNLTARRYDPLEVITTLKALPNALPLLAFAGHIELEKHQQARTAGADIVAANSSVALHLPALLRRLLGKSTGDTPDAEPDADEENPHG